MSTTQAQLADPAHPARRYPENAEWITAVSLPLHPACGVVTPDHPTYHRAFQAFRTAMAEFFTARFWNCITYDPRHVQERPDVDHYLMFSLHEKGYHAELMRVIATINKDEYRPSDHEELNRKLRMIPEDIRFGNWTLIHANEMACSRPGHADWWRTTLFVRALLDLRNMFLDDSLPPSFSRLPASQAMPWHIGKHWWRLHHTPDKLRKVVDRHTNAVSSVSWDTFLSGDPPETETHPDQPKHAELSVEIWRKIFGYVHEKCLREFMGNKLADYHVPPPRESNWSFTGLVHHTLTVRVDSATLPSYTVSDTDLSRFNAMPLIATHATLTRAGFNLLLTVRVGHEPEVRLVTPAGFGRRWRIHSAVDGITDSYVFISWTQLRWAVGARTRFEQVHTE
jgi:hypothetical protein